MADRSAGVFILVGRFECFCVAWMQARKFSSGFGKFVATRSTAEESGVLNACLFSKSL